MPLDTKTGLILVNLGTPTSSSTTDVRRFLRVFLSDPRVVNLPRVLWFPILYCIILPLRSAKVAKLYKKIWWPEGSPLKVITQRQAQKLAALFAKNKIDVQTRYAMVYGEPSLKNVTTELLTTDVKEIIVLPLYPQYCSATTGSVLDQVDQLQKKSNSSLSIKVIKEYHSHPHYIDALAQSIQENWNTVGKGEYLLFSFHGIPQALIDSGDPYYQQCHKTAALVAGKLQLTPDAWRVSFQSRFGKAEWAKPYTDIVIQELAGKGLKKLDVVTPAFASDCLETLEEIAVQNAELFQHAGGETLTLIPCLNDNDKHISMMQTLFEEKSD